MKLLHVRVFAGWGRLGMTRAQYDVAGTKISFEWEKRVIKMQQNADPRKRPLLTAEQLQIIRRVTEKPKKGSPREEFEKLFRQPNGWSQT
jgi:hypothetical protein